MSITQTARLSDTQLVAEVKRLVGGERDTVVQLIVHLAEMDGRDIHLAAGYPSLYIYCSRSCISPDTRPTTASKSHAPASRSRGSSACSKRAHSP